MKETSINSFGHLPSGHYHPPSISVRGTSVVMIVMTVVVPVVRMVVLVTLVIILVIIIVVPGWKLDEKFHISSQHVGRGVLRHGQTHPAVDQTVQAVKKEHERHDDCHRDYTKLRNDV